MSNLKPQIGIIGGSGLYSMKQFKLKKKVNVKTPFGKPSDSYLVGTLAGVDVVFLPRHGVGHKISPTELNFRANIWGFKTLGIKSLFSVSAVGSLKKKIEPSHMVVVDQFIDRTQHRQSSFFEKGIVAHVALADPVCHHLREILIDSSKKSGAKTHKKGTYICMEGPQFSTRAESNLYRSWGADVIGMTNFQEAKLAREAEICYATLALSTDYDCWHDEHDAVTTDQVIEVLQKNVSMAQKIMARAVKKHKTINCDCHSALKNAILTDPAKITKANQQKYKLLIGKYIK